jgi:hypothetical protein
LDGRDGGEDVEISAIKCLCESAQRLMWAFAYSLDKK